MTRYLWLSVIGSTVLLWTIPASGESAWERVGGAEDRIGFVAATWGPEAALVDEQLERRSGRDDTVVVRKAPVEVENTESEKRRIETIRDEGSERFFYRGPKSARKYLSGEVGSRLDATRRWMHDPAGSSALFEAAIYLIRACLERGDRAGAEAWMERLVAALPAHRPESRKVPPDVVELWEEIRDQSKVREAVVDVSAVDRDRCDATLNGASFDGVSVDVAAGRSYLLSVDCEERPGSHYWVMAQADEIRQFQWLGESPDRQQLHEVLAQLRERWDLERIVYIGPGSCEDATCLAVVEAGESASEVSIAGFTPEVVKNWGVGAAMGW